LSYPAYLGKIDEVVKNAGDITVPEGTNVEWSVVTKNTTFVDFIFNGKKQRFENEGFKVNKKILNTSDVSFLLSNKYKNKIDSSNLVVNVVKDAYPSIQVEEVIDSLSDGLRFFTGNISDERE
jgi:hypothetical protein